MGWLKKALGIGALSLVSLMSSPKKAEACSSAIPLGRGGTDVAVADTASAVYWNPAGLVQLERPEMDLTISPTEKYRVFACYAQPINKDNAFGINFNNRLNNNIEELHYRLSYSGRLSENFSIGTSLLFRDKYELNSDVKREYLNSDLYSNIGLLYKPNDNIKLGLLLQQLNRSEGVNVRPGISFKLDDRTFLAFDGYDVSGSYHYSDPSDGKEKSYRHLRCGLERRLNDAISIRGGLRFQEFDGVEIGGINIGGSAGISYRNGNTETSISTGKDGFLITINKKF